MKQYNYTPCPRCGTTTYTNTCNCRPYRVTFTGYALGTTPQDVHAYSPDHAAEKACTLWDTWAKAASLERWGKPLPERPLSTYSDVRARVEWQGDLSPQAYTITLRTVGRLTFYQATLIPDKTPRQLSLL